MFHLWNWIFSICCLFFGCISLYRFGYVYVPKLKKRSKTKSAIRGASFFRTCLDKKLRSPRFTYTYQSLIMSQHYFKCSDLTYDDILDRFDEAWQRGELEPKEIFLEIVKSDKYLATFAQKGSFCDTVTFCLVQNVPKSVAHLGDENPKT